MSESPEFLKDCRLVVRVTVDDFPGLTVRCSPIEDNGVIVRARFVLTILTAHEIPRAFSKRLSKAFEEQLEMAMDEDTAVGKMLRGISESDELIFVTE